MPEFLRNQELQFVVLAVFAGLAVVVPIAIYLISRRRKKLSYEVLTNTRMISVQDEVAGNVKILYKNLVVKDIHLVIIKVFNSGGVPIEVKDYVQNICFKFGDEAQVLAVDITEQNPDNLDAALDFEEVADAVDVRGPNLSRFAAHMGVVAPSVSQAVSQAFERLNQEGGGVYVPAGPDLNLPKQVRLDPVLLNRNYSVTATFLVSQLDEVKVEGLIVGVQKIDRKEPTASRLYLAFVQGLLWPVFILFAYPMSVLGACILFFAYCSIISMAFWHVADNKSSVWRPQPQGCSL